MVFSTIFGKKKEEKKDTQKEIKEVASPRVDKKENEEAVGEDDPSYSDIVKRLEKSNYGISAYETIITEDDETSKKNANQATEDQIKQEIELLFGANTREWSSENEECVLFRKNMANAREIDEKMAALALPPVYLSDDPLPEGAKKEGFVCRINLVAKNMKKAVKFEPDMTAEEFAESFVIKINNAHNFNRKKEDWIFKATGTAEYLYGTHKMIDFEHIRKCVKKGHRVDLNLMDREAVIAELDPNDQKLKSITYDVDYVKGPSPGPEHDKITFEANSWDKMECISMWDLHRPFRVKILGVDSIFPSPEFKSAIGDVSDCVLFVHAELVHGGISLAKPKFTQCIPFSREPRFNQFVVFDDILISEIPRETKICFTLYARKSSDQTLTGPAMIKNAYPVGYVCSAVLDFKGTLRVGKQKLRCWPDSAAKPISICVENLGDENSFVLSFENEQYALPVVFPSGNPPKKLKERFQQYEEAMRAKYPDLADDKLKSELDRLISQDPLYELNEEEKWRLWTARTKLKNNPKSLSKFLSSVPYQYPEAVIIAHNMLHEWTPLKPVDAMELLDFNFADKKIRQYAIKRLNEFTDNELEGYVLQLAQTLKFELYHDSALARFLLQRGLRSTHIIGHILFWHLKAEMHSPLIRERHGLILEEYLKNCGGHRRELLKQNGVVNQLLNIAMKIKKTKGADRLRVLREELSTNFKHPPKFKLPLSPRMEVKGIIPEKCKVMDSKKLPIWLAFENADPTADPILVIFKAGDDLRQDLLTLQMLRIMDKLWKINGLDLHLQPYGCVCTGDMTGMIEVVLNSDTIANITASRGGATAAFTSDPLYVWLKKHNTNKDDWPKVVDNFVHSCAGYCCATYVLGIGDRHNDNIMLSKKGDLFHIDFGHFLGHFKTFAGIKRETTPFVFTPMYAHVMGGNDSAAFEKFRSLGAKAFNILRSQGPLMMNLFLLMLATGIPELQSIEDIMWLRKCLVMDKTEEEATKWFYEKVKESLGNTRARINDAVHILAHKK